MIQGHVYQILLGFLLNQMHWPGLSRKHEQIRYSSNVYTLFSFSNVPPVPPLPPLPQMSMVIQ